MVLNNAPILARIDQADAELLPRIREIKAAHPFGLPARLVVSSLSRKIIIGKNAFYRILTEHDLLVTRKQAQGMPDARALKAEDHCAQ